MCVCVWEGAGNFSVYLFCLLFYKSEKQGAFKSKLVTSLGKLSLTHFNIWLKRAMFLKTNGSFSYKFFSIKVDQAYNTGSQEQLGNFLNSSPPPLTKASSHLSDPSFSSTTEKVCTNKLFIDKLELLIFIYKHITKKQKII